VPRLEVQPRLPKHCVSVSRLQGVGEPVQYGIPDPGPVRSHQPASIQRVFAGQSLSTMHFVTQMCAPMHMLYWLKSEVQSASELHDVLHCWSPMYVDVSW